MNRQTYINKKARENLFKKARERRRKRRGQRDFYRLLFFQKAESMRKDMFKMI